MHIPLTYVKKMSYFAFSKIVLIFLVTLHCLSEEKVFNRLMRNSSLLTPNSSLNRKSVVTP